MISAGLALVAIGLGLFTLAGVTSEWWIVLPGELVALIGTGLFNPAVTNVALTSAPLEQSGVAAGVNDTFRQAGIAVGVAALGALIPAENALGGGSAQGYVDGLHDALWAGAGLALVGRDRRRAVDLQVVRRRGRDAARRGARRVRRPRGAARLDTARHARSVAIVLDGDRAA